MPRQVIFRERGGDGAALAGLHADDLLLEARNEAVRADDHLDVGAGTALERLAADLADEVDRQLVALLGRRLRLFRRIGAVLARHAVEHLLDFRFRHVDDETLQL